MTDAEWLVSDDPVAMLRVATGSISPCCGGYWLNNPDGSISMSTDQKYCSKCINISITVNTFKRISSDRKLRLWACQCSRMNDNASEEELSRWGTEADARFITDWARYATEKPSKSERAALLRDVVGNPFRPVTLPDGGPCPGCRGDGGVWIGDNISAPTDWWDCPDCGGSGRRHCPWLTPQALSLARAAYEGRGRGCPECDDGIVMREDVAYGVERTACPCCNGTGRIDDGTLDPLTLCAVADALEEAGCDNEELLWHLRGFEDVPCTSGDTTQTIVRVSLRGPHVRGCWALDLILGKE